MKERYYKEMDISISYPPPTKKKKKKEQVDAFFLYETRQQDNEIRAKKSKARQKKKEGRRGMKKEKVAIKGEKEKEGIQISGCSTSLIS